MFVRLGLKEVADVIKTLGISSDIMYLHGNIDVNGKLYIYEKKGNQLTITGEDGKSVTIGINYSEEKAKDYQNRDVLYLKHEVSIDYKLEDGHHITFYRDIPLERGYESFENVNRHDLLSGVKTGYVGKDGEEASFSVGLNKVCFNGSKKVYEFTSDGIICGNRLITVDGGQLVSISGEVTPGLDEAKSFDLIKERAKIENFLKSGVQLHPFTREMLKDAYRKLDRKDRYAKDIIHYYDEEIGEVRKALEVRNNIISGIDTAIDPAAIDKAASAFREIVIKQKHPESTIRF